MEIKVRALSFVFIFGIVLSGLTGCKKNAVDPTKGLSAKIQSIVPQATLDDMKAKGFVINEGSQPPNVEGIFEASPYKLLAPYGPEDGWKKDRVISDYRFRFSSQNGDDIKLDLKALSASDASSGVSSFLAGNGNKFTLFGEQSGTASGIPYKSLTVISGEITSTGIRDFQYAFVFTSKNGDASNSQLIPVGKSRVWIDGDALAGKVGSFRLGAPETAPVKQAAGSAVDAR